MVAMAGRTPREQQSIPSEAQQHHQQLQRTPGDDQQQYLQQLTSGVDQQQ